MTIRSVSDSGISDTNWRSTEAYRQDVGLRMTPHTSPSTISFGSAGYVDPHLHKHIGVDLRSHVSNVTPRKQKKKKKTKRKPCKKQEQHQRERSATMILQCFSDGSTFWLDLDGSESDTSAVSSSDSSTTVETPAPRIARKRDGYNVSPSVGAGISHLMTRVQGYEQKKRSNPNP